MRHGPVAILAAVVLTGLTGCGNRPNNLETYYDEPSNTTSTAAPPAAPARNAPPLSSRGNDIAQQVNAAVLTEDDLADEGVRPATQQPISGACFDGVPAGDPRGATWRFSNGSTFTQHVVGYLEKSATDVLAAVRCDGEKLTLSRPKGADEVRAWCQGKTCTALLATGHVLSGIQVTASSSSRAIEALKTIVPIAAAKLPRS